MAEESPKSNHFIAYILAACVVLGVAYQFVAPPPQEPHAQKHSTVTLPDAPPPSAVSVFDLSGDPEAGKTLFVTNCAPCHQPEGQGLVGLAPSIRNRDFLALATDDFIRTTVKLGRAGTAMVPRPDLNEDNVDNIIAYLRSLPIANPIDITVDPHFKALGDAAAGATKFTTYCASCHGPKGEGYIAGGSGPGIGMVGFLAVANDDYIYKSIKHGRVGTPMMGFIGATGLANLTDQDAFDIITHLRTLKQASMAPAAATTAVTETPDAEKGKAIFAINCSPCHQVDGAGKPGLAPSIRNRDFLAIASDEFIRNTVGKGRVGTAMVPRPDLNDETVGHIIAFLRSLEVTNPITIDVDNSITFSGDTADGKIKYATYCASCHGQNGEGYLAGGSGPGIGMAGFLATASDDYIFKTVKHGRVGTGMMGFIGATGLANLTETQVHNIIAYLRSK